MIDFHSHILPGIDDGSESLEHSLEMLAMEARQGITHVVATPHFYPRHDRPEEFLTRRNLAARTLKAAMEAHPGLPEITLGAEVYFFRGISDSDILPELTIGDKNCILIEMPPAPWPDSVYEELTRIWERRRIRPVVAHIDRYIAPLRTHGIPVRLEKLPVLVQANADFFLNPGTTRMAMKMLKADRIHLLGSDCHDPDTRKPNMGQAMKRIAEKLGPDALGRIHGYEHQIMNP